MVYGWLWLWQILLKNLWLRGLIEFAQNVIFSLRSFQTWKIKLVNLKKVDKVFQFCFPKKRPWVKWRYSKKMDKKNRFKLVVLLTVNFFSTLFFYFMGEMEKSWKLLQLEFARRKGCNFENDREVWWTF